MVIDVGVRGEARLIVTDADTGLAMRTGTVSLLSTSRLAALCEQAAIAAIQDTVSASRTTVGMRIQIDHLQPVRVGCEVVAEAMLDKVEGRRLTFHVSVSDPRGLIAAGKMVRVVVDVEHFLDRAT